MFRSPKDVAILHREVVKSNSNIGYSCDICGQGPWLTEVDVEIHRKHAHKWDLIKALNDDSIHICSICLRVQKDKKTLIEHILVTHLCAAPNATRINREIFICDYCNRLFFNKQLLITHMYHWHSSKTEKHEQSVTTNCPKCWKNIRMKSLWFHLLHHGALNVATCPICLESCDNRDEMLQHLKTHPGYFCCNICGYETTKECFFNNHLVKHKKKLVYNDGEDVSRFFLPQKLHPSLYNRMNNVFKGIPLANEVKVCILCRALCVSDSEMRDHILGEHVPDEKETSKTHQCTCREVFFNSVLLKHHIFKMKGNHRAWDGVSPLPELESSEDQIVLQVYEIDNPISMVNEIIIQGISNLESEDSNSQNEKTNDDQEFEEMEV